MFPSFINTYYGLIFDSNMFSSSYKFVIYHDLILKLKALTYTNSSVICPVVNFFNDNKMVNTYNSFGFSYLNSKLDGSAIGGLSDLDYTWKSKRLDQEEHMPPIISTTLDFLRYYPNNWILDSYLGYKKNGRFFAFFNNFKNDFNSIPKYLLEDRLRFIQAISLKFEPKFLPTDFLYEDPEEWDPSDIFPIINFNSNFKGLTSSVDSIWLPRDCYFLTKYHLSELDLSLRLYKNNFFKLQHLVHIRFWSTLNSLIFSIKDSQEAFNNLDIEVTNEELFWLQQNFNMTNCRPKIIEAMMLYPNTSGSFFIKLYNYILINIMEANSFDSEELSSFFGVAFDVASLIPGRLSYSPFDFISSGTIDTKRYSLPFFNLLQGPYVSLDHINGLPEGSLSNLFTFPFDNIYTKEYSQPLAVHIADSCTNPNAYFSFNREWTAYNIMYTNLFSDFSNRLDEFVYLDVTNFNKLENSSSFYTKYQKLWWSNLDLGLFNIEAVYNFLHLINTRSGAGALYKLFYSPLSFRDTWSGIKVWSTRRKRFLELGLGNSYASDVIHAYLFEQIQRITWVSAFVPEKNPANFINSEWEHSTYLQNHFTWNSQRSLQPDSFGTEFNLSLRPYLSKSNLYNWDQSLDKSSFFHFTNSATAYPYLLQLQAIRNNLIYILIKEHKEIYRNLPLSYCLSCYNDINFVQSSLNSDMLYLPTNRFEIVSWVAQLKQIDKESISLYIDPTLVNNVSLFGITDYWEYIYRVENWEDKSLDKFKKILGKPETWPYINNCLVISTSKNFDFQSSTTFMNFKSSTDPSTILRSRAKIQSKNNLLSSTLYQIFNKLS